MSRRDLDTRQQWRYTDEEWERLQVRTAPRIMRPVVYIYWLTKVMPDGTGLILGAACVMLCFSLAAGIVIGIIMGVVWVGTHAAWVFWLLLGAGLALVARAVLRDAAAAERRVQRSLAAKEHAHGTTTQE